MHVRRAEREDAAAVRRVAADAIRRTFGGVGGCGPLVAGAERPGFAAEVAAWLRARAGLRNLVAVGDAGEVVGFLALDWHPDRVDAFVRADEALVGALYVAPARWREGIGSRLLDAGRGHLPGHVDRLVVAVVADNPVAHGFYRSYGFERAGETSYEEGGTRYDCPVYGLEV
jgi:ribosomal protein S18 acetylase RimI-like enzyme